MATSVKRRQSSPAPAKSGDISPESARAAVERVLASEAFQASETLSRFLRHLTERKIEDRTEGLKEYTIGVDVLGREPSFDPRTDSIVRVEASRLRARLTAYYKTAGAGDPVRIELPRGSYVPVFRQSTPESSSKVAASRRVVSAAAALLLVAAAAWLAIGNQPFRIGRTDPAGITVAVLPFVNLSAGVENDRLSDSMTEDTVAMLARVEGLRVVARSSAFQYKDRNVDVRQIGRELNVAAVVEGTVRRHGRRIRISAQVADTADGFQRWQRTWERPFEDAPQIHEEVARGIAHALNAPPPGETFLLGKRAPNAEAYRLVVEARYLTPTTPENAAIRIAHYRKAVGYDPAYPAAWVGMADTWSRLANAAEVPPHQVMTQAREAAAKALELDSALADAHLLAAGIHWNYDWDWTAADREFRRAIQLDPDSSTIRNFYAQYLAQMGRFTEAFKEIEGMRTLEPLTAASRTMEAQVYFLSRQYDRTIRLCQTVLESHPDIWGLRYWLGRAYGSTGDLRRSKEILEALHPPGALEGRGFGMLGATYASAGRRSDALRLLERAMQRGRQRYVSPVSIAQIHIGLGDYDQAFEWLEKGYRDRDSTMTTLKVEPAFDAVRTDPRFVSLLSRMKLQ